MSGDYEPVRSRYLDVGGIRTHYLDAGDGPPVVLLHSGEFGGSAELCWEFNIGPLARDFRVIAPDWLGFGGTDKLRDFVAGSDRMIRHMSAFLAAMAIDQADFAGASMGATMLLREAARPGCRFPIRRLVVSSGGGFVPDNEERRRLLSYDGTPEAMRAILRANFHDPSWAQDDAYVKRRVEASLAPGAWEAVAAARLKPPTMAPRRAFGQPDTIDYERIRYPTLVLAGAEDKLRLPGYHQALGRIPDARIVVLAEAGHLLNIEKAGEFNDLVRRFLLDHDAGGDADG